MADWIGIASGALWCPWPKPKATWADTGQSSRPCRSFSKLRDRERAQIVARVARGVSRDEVMRTHQIGHKTLERVLAGWVPEAKGDTGRLAKRCACGRVRSRKADRCRQCAIAARKIRRHRVSRRQEQAHG